MLALSPKRRWLAYSTRTLLVAVTIFCVWLGWQVSIVRERSYLRSRFEPSVSFNEKFGTDFLDAFFDLPAQPRRVSWIREVMGDKWVGSIWYSELDPNDLERIKGAFPEAGLCKTKIEWPFADDSEPSQ
jgi:hypothetical protein